jgi:hypothetical protein
MSSSNFFYVGRNDDYELYESSNSSKKYNYSEEALKGVLEVSKLSQAFFSQQNIAILQKKLKSEVYRLTNKKIILEVDQDEKDLVLAMRAIYIEHAKHLDTNITEQINELNMLTVNYVIPDMMNAIKQQYGFLKDQNTPLNPIDRPLNVHSGKNILATAPCFM